MTLPPRPIPERYVTAGGVAVSRTPRTLDYLTATDPLVRALDERRGVLFSSTYEFPGRYARWDMGFVDPPIVLTARGRELRITALNPRGRVLLPALRASLAGCDAIADLGDDGPARLTARVRAGNGPFPEEARSRQPSVFSALRAIIGHFGSDQDGALGLYGAFGYDLAYQFEDVAAAIPRDPDQRDLVLYLPDRVVLVDHHRQHAEVLDYEFEVAGHGTAGLERGGEALPYRPASRVARTGDHAPGDFAETVRTAKQAFARGDLFEVVPGQTFFEPCPDSPAEVFLRLRHTNPAPYGFLINLGRAEYLVGASPEMFVRVTGRRLETCPISGTIKRGDDPIGDAKQILTLLNSAKDEAELTMCTDVDRNDKARICEPGSVRVIGRRQIEIYSRLIHTVDHVEGRLQPGRDALDAFLSHTWAVTVTGAPKRWAMEFLERHERAPRAWYGGAVGAAYFSGDMNTGLTLRTIRIKDGAAEVRAGATLLADSDPEAEERETELKASAALAAVRGDGAPRAAAAGASDRRPGTGRRILLIDHQDSFVHMLADYFRQTGATVETYRFDAGPAHLVAAGGDLVVLSPGPGRPSDFGMAALIEALVKARRPLFGVCLGLQGICEHFGAPLNQLARPMHGKQSEIAALSGRLFAGLPARLRVGRYHSLYVKAADLPPELTASAVTDDGIVMAIEHRDLAIAAVQFHPESIMTLDGHVGQTIIANAVAGLTGSPVPADVID